MFARSSMIGSFLASPSRALAPLAPFMAPCGARSGPPRARFGTAVEKTDRLAADGGDGCTGGKRCDGSVTERGPRRPQLRGLHRRPGRVHVDHPTASALPRRPVQSLVPQRDAAADGRGDREISRLRDGPQQRVGLRESLCTFYETVFDIIVEEPIAIKSRP